MALRDFCKSLQQCAEKLEAELRININDFNNLMHGNTVDETKISLERAKDYHFQEIIEAVSVILEKVRVVIFHQEKIDWLSDDTNFSANYLKRFSYVKKQIYDFSKQQQMAATFSRSEQNLSVPYKVKRERRRTASEVSVSTLEAWEKYLDQKGKGSTESVNDIEVKKEVPKRTTSKARARKKFVSSTFVGFLDNEANKRAGLESIVENPAMVDEQRERATEDSDGKSDQVLQSILDQFLYKYEEKPLEGSRISRSCGSLTGLDQRKDTEVKLRSKSNDCLLEGEVSASKEDTKPRIVDVIYKTVTSPT